MKIKLLIIIGLVSFLGYSQDDYQLPNFTPPSPEASAMTKYGDVQINENTGMVSQTIPLYTYKAGNLELPISINYTGAGVKVDELPTWTGIKWTLNAGGVITRTVKDLPDELAGGNRVIISDIESQEYSTLINGTSETQYVYSIIGASNPKDTEVDIFTFNFLNYNGSFYLNENFEGVLLKNNSPLKIETVYPFTSSKQIIITTPDGVRYVFGGQSATEDTELRYISSGSLQTVNSQGTTSFYLKKIEHPINGEILFDYINDNLSNIQLSKEQSKNAQKLWYPGFDEIIECCGNVPNINTTVETTTITNRIYNQKFLSRIYSFNTNQEIHFNSISIDNANFKRELKSIEVLSETFNLKTIHFDYIKPQSSIVVNGGYTDKTKRFFLDRITFDLEKGNNLNGQNNRLNEVYEFKYNIPSALPDRFSYAQDYLGYYNGKINNPNLLPYNDIFSSNPNSNYADRDPVFEYASSGVLTDIYYPTGGHTNFEYEAPKVKERVTERINLYTYRNQQNKIPNSFLYDGVPKIGEDEEGNNIVIFGDQMLEDEIININLTAKAELSNLYPTFFPEQEKVTLKITDLSNNNVTTNIMTFITPSGPTNSGVITQSNNYNFNVFAGRKYKVELFIEDTNEVAGTEVPMEAFITFNFFKGYRAINGAGIRVKKTTDFINNSEVSNIKRYYYSDINNINPSPSELDYPVRYFKITKHVNNFICISNESCELGSQGTNEFFVKNFRLHSGSFENYFSKNDLGIYEKVTISSGGDNFESGGVEKTFYYFDDVFPFKTNTEIIFGQNDYDSSVSDPILSFPSVLNGQLKNEKVFKSQIGVISKIQEKSFDYYFSAVNSINNIFGNYQYNLLSYPLGSSISNCLSNYYVGIYKVYSYKSEIKSQVSTDYIDPVPLGVTDESAYKKVVTTQNYEYGALRGLPTKITTTTSQSGVINEVRNFYVNQATNPNYHTGLTVDQIQAVIDLNAQNIVSNPILVQQFKNNEKLGTKKTLYKNIGTNPSFPKIVPDIIQSGKGEETDNPLENRVRFLEYDGFGRPTLVSLENGTKTKYYYNGRNQVVMKIENFIAGSGSGGTITADDVVLQSSTDPCVYNTQFSTGIVTVYVYDSATNLLTKIIDTNCIETTYEYDALHRLKFIKDNDGNIIQEFDTSFKRY